MSLLIPRAKTPDAKMISAFYYVGKVGRSCDFEVALATNDKKAIAPLRKILIMLFKLYNKLNALIRFENLVFLK